jgi:hypothetical protein
MQWKLQTEHLGLVPEIINLIPVKVFQSLDAFRNNFLPKPFLPSTKLNWTELNYKKNMKKSSCWWTYFELHERREFAGRDG